MPWKLDELKFPISRGISVQITFTERAAADDEVLTQEDFKKLIRQLELQMECYPKTAARKKKTAKFEDLQ